MSVGPVLQSNWDWRAASNFILGGTGSGLVLVAALVVLMGADAAVFGLPGAVLVATGLGIVSLELGRQLRSLNVFRNPRTSWMAREAWVAVALVTLGLLAFVSRSNLVLMVAAVAAGLFLYAQARILKAAKGIPAWRVPQIVPLIITTGLAEGAGLLLLLQPLLVDPGSAASSSTLWLALVLLVLRLVAWMRYWGALQSAAPDATLRVLAPVDRIFVLVGHLLPAVLLLAAVLISSQRVLLAILAAIPMLLSGWLTKFHLITRAAYTQGYAIPHSPARGGGKPGPGVKPGWPLAR